MKTHVLILVLLTIASNLIGQWSTCPIDISRTHDSDELTTWVRSTESDTRFIMIFNHNVAGMYDLVAEITVIFENNDIQTHEIRSTWPSYVENASDASRIRLMAKACLLGEGKMLISWVVNKRWLLMASANDEYFGLVLDYYGP